jgi:hypothetical protein
MDQIIPPPVLTQDEVRVGAWAEVREPLERARVFGNSADFWLNVQRRSDLWEAMNSPRERERIKRARRLVAAA